MLYMEQGCRKQNLIGQAKVSMHAQSSDKMFWTAMSNKYPKEAISAHLSEKTQ